MTHAAEVWQSVMTQLKSELPRAQYETWVHDTQAITLDKSVLTICARNHYSRNWLESRLTTPIQDILKGILGSPITVRFITHERGEELEREDEPNIEIEPVGWLDYDVIVQPHRQVVVKGYLRRLGMEIGPKAIWLYIGFHQTAWMAQDKKTETGNALHSRLILRYSALSHGAFWRLLKSPKIQQDLRGLVQRVDNPAVRRFRRGRDGRPHRAPIRYIVFMTPRLTRADATSIYSRLKSLLDHGASISNALKELLDAGNVMQLLDPEGPANPHIPFDTVMDMARFEEGGDCSPEVERLSQELQRRIVNSMGDIHITHYFITHTIKQFDLTPAQAWLVTVARDMAYINSRTGERREVVTFKGGFEEMAALVASNRYKTVQAWFNPQWITQQRGGDIKRFLVEVETSESNTYSDLRTSDMPRTYRVLLDEPLDADGTLIPAANGSNRLDADGTSNRTQMEGIAGADGSHMVDANGTVLNSFKHPHNTKQKNTSTTQHKVQAAGAVPQFWELETLLRQNDVHPKVQKELLEMQASVHAFVSWVLYVASPKSGNLSDPLGYALSRLREHPLREARGVFRKLADLPPEELLSLIDSIPQSSYALPAQVDHPLAAVWRKTMGANNRRLPLIRTILFGQGGEE